MKRISHLICITVLFFAPFQSAQSSKVIPKKNASKKKITLPEEYLIFERARRDSLLEKLTFQQISSHQNELKKLNWNVLNRNLQKEAEDLFWYYEIQKGEKLNGDEALASWVKALNTLHPFKWIYAWKKTTSEALVKICRPVSKKKKPIPVSQLQTEKCDYLMKKVLDAFPKNSIDTMAIREVYQEPESVDPALDRFERLSQPYSEKTEKDEQAFAEILDHYLNYRDSELNDVANKFIETFPRSILRFRAMFLMAERFFARGDQEKSAPLYQEIIRSIPYGYYAIVASERMGISLKERIGKDSTPVKTETTGFRLNFLETESLERLEELIRLKKFESAGMEFEQFTRTRSYPTEFLLGLIRLANRSEQDLAGFRFASEILQRKNEVPFTREFIELIFPDRYSRAITDQAKQQNLDPLLVVSLIKQESGFKSGILSSSGAAGLMQLMPFTAIEVQKDLELHQLRDSSKNIEIGTRYLSSLLNEKYKGNVVYALAGYNAGPNRVMKWKKDSKGEWGMQEFIESIPYKETRDYVMSILRNRYWYQFRKGLPQQSVFEAWRSP